jgi:hypothetical protein
MLKHAQLPRKYSNLVPRRLKVTLEAADSTILVLVLPGQSRHLNANGIDLCASRPSS